MPLYEIEHTITRIHVVEAPDGQRALDILWFENDDNPDQYIVEESGTAELTGNIVSNPDYLFDPIGS